MFSRFPLLWKVATLIGLTLLMLIPVSMVMNMIDERQSYQQSVIEQVSSSTSGAQTVIGPILVLPYVKTVKEKIENQWIEKHYLYHRYLLPKKLLVNGDIDVNARKIGIYQAQVYQGDIKLEGEFEQFSYSDLLDENITLGSPFLVLSLSDTRGVTKVPEIQLNSEQYVFEPGAKESGFSQGIHVPLTADVLNQKNMTFSLKLAVQGTEKLAFVPVGGTTELTLSSNWPHPNFIGSFLPTTRVINEQGFTATWQSSWFANNINDRFKSYEKRGLERYDTDRLPAFSTSLVETVDQYQLNERSVKYAVLFISLTFIAFFLFEMLAHLRVHPIQYLLVGMALVMFYLILLALSERLGFVVAYIIAALACSGLIAFYLSTVLKGLTRGIGFGVGLLILYGILFIVLQSEGNALLLGTVLIFSILAGIMALTRRIDWYSVSTATKAKLSTDKVAIDEEKCRLWK